MKGSVTIPPSNHMWKTAPARNVKESNCSQNFKNAIYELRIKCFLYSELFKSFTPSFIWNHINHRHPSIMRSSHGNRFRDQLIQNSPWQLVSCEARDIDISIQFHSCLVMEVYLWSATLYLICRWRHLIIPAAWVTYICVFINIFVYMCEHKTPGSVLW